MLKLKDYVNLKLIQEGRRNVIYSATRVSDGLSVILKVIRGTNPTEEDLALIYHEFDLCKDLDLPGVIKTYAILEDVECYALVQESIHGISLQEYIKQQQYPVKNLSDFFKIAMQMVKSLGEIHRQRIIHKDIKPSNFIIEPTSLTVKLTDFNFAVKLLHEMQDVIPPDRLVGTLAYMAPEQTGRMNMNVDYRSDFYALGVSYYELLTGDIPFHATDPFEMVHAHIAVPAPNAAELNPDIPESLAKILQKLMAKDPADRYQSAIGILEDLTQVAQNSEKPFVLGQKDVYDCLNISQKLYGRKDEIKFLLSAYDRVSQGAVEALMVSGYSGIGKTMLINEVHKPMVKHKGYFISGKFNRLQRDTPYTAITQAFNQLARLILSEPEARFEALKEAIIDALGGVAQVMIDLAPMLELIIGPQPPLEKLPARETQNRMMIFFKRFIRVIASKNHPLVIFIDDLQWVDNSSLKLLEYIITDEDLSHILLIGAYRDNEVDSHHPLLQFFKEMEDQEKKIHLLPLGPLKLVDFESLFKDSFNREDTAIKSLAEFVHKCTGGNSFFCKQVISTLYDEKFLFFDYEKRRWDWDLEKIKTLKITDNVVELLLTKLSELPNETLQLLRYAACVGNLFSVEKLMMISGKPANEINKNLEPALQNELIQLQHSRFKELDFSSEKMKETTYQFIHDRVHQAVDQEISHDEKQKIHLSIARLMIEKELDACRNELLFEVTDHFNQSHSLLKENGKMLVVTLNYHAGLKAFSANAYNSMKNYLQAGLNLTSEEWWKSDYELMFGLNLAYAESLYLTGTTEESALVTDDLLERAKTTYDKASIYRIQSLQFHMSGNINLTVETGLKALDLLGIKIPKLPSHMSVWTKFLQIRVTLWKHKVENLNEELNSLSDKNILMAFQILNDIFYSAYSVPGNMYTYLLLESMYLMLQHGKPPSAGLWVTGYALAVLNLTKNVGECFKLWDLAERLMEQEKDKYSSPYSYWIMGYFLNHLRYPFKEAKVYCQRGIRDAVESGNLQAAIINMGAMAGIIRGESKSLVKLRENQEETLNYARKIHMKELAEATGFVASLADVELGRVQPGEEQIILYRQLLGKGRLQETIRSMQMGRYFYFLESYEIACKYHFSWYVEEKRLRYNVNTFSQKTLDGLSIAKCIPELPFFKKIRYKIRFQQLCKDLKWAAKECPANYEHQYFLLLGAQASLKGKNQKAIRAFEKAAEVAKKSGAYLWVGIANELVGNLLMEQGFHRYAIDYIQEAHYYYERYGLKLKVNALEKRYPHCFVNRMEGGLKMWGETDKASTMSTTSSDLDISSVIKASQSISEELVLENLFAKVLHIMIENAGAQKAVFIEKVNKQWQVTASLVHQKDGNQFKIHNVLLKDFIEVPHLVLNSSLRSKEPLIINNPKADPQYADDLYVSSVAPKSVLCLPIVYKEKQVGLIYLENNLTIGAFTEKRIHLLRTLSTQIVISLENARHFEHVEFMYRAMERFVPKRFLQLLQREHVEDVKLGDSVKCKLSALFADIRGFTTLAETLSPERTALLLNTYMRYMAPIIRKNKGFVNQFLGDGLMALFPETPSDSVDAAVAMNEMLPSFNKKIETQGFAPISVGIGINSGDAMICALGEEERLDASVVSDAINTASRVEGLNKYYKTRLLISEAVYKQLNQSEEKYLIRLIDRVFLKGKSQATRIYEVSSLPTWENLDTERDYIKSFSSAFKLYERGNFREAESIFKSCLEQKPNDYVAEILMKRCVGFIASGMPPGWDGTSVFLEK